MHRFALHALLALAAGGIAGCWPLFTVEPGSPGAPQVATAEIPPSTPPTQVSQPPERHRNSSYKHTNNKSAHAATSDHPTSDAGGNSAPEAPPPSLTLAGESTSRAQAQQLVDRADRGLAKIDRSKLTGTDVTTYDQASGFISSAQRALGENDYFAASGLAEKASTLTSRLVH